MNDKRCFTSKCGTQVFAYFNLVLVVISSIVAYAALIGITVLLVAFNFVDGIIALLLALLFLAPAIAILFAVILFVGVQNENPKFLLAYIIYGGVVIFLVTFVSSLCYILYIDDDLMILAGIFLACGIYSLILFMIVNTYWQFQKAKYRKLECITSKKKFLE